MKITIETITFQLDGVKIDSDGVLDGIDRVWLLTPIRDKIKYPVNLFWNHVPEGGEVEEEIVRLEMEERAQDAAVDAVHRKVGEMYK